MPRRSSRVVLAVVGLAVALVVTACSGGESRPTDADAPSPPAVLASTPSPSPEIAQEEEEAGDSHPGEPLYGANCQVCHGTQSGQGGVVGAPPHNETGHTWHHPDAQLTDWVLNGKFPGAMPAFGDRLSIAEVSAVLSFIKTWWTPEQRETQADVSQRYQEAIDRQERGR